MEKSKLAAAMFIVGSIGLFVHYIPLPPAVIACARAVIGTLFLLLVLRLKKTPLHGQAIRKNALCLLLSGAALGFNWIFLFEAFRHTGIAVATLCYYMAPVFVILLSPLVLGERLTRRKIVCTLLAVLGAVCISGVFTGSRQDPRGIAFGLAAALLYCSLILLNKRLRGLDTLETTFCQLCTAALVMLPYVLLGGHLHGLAPAPSTLFLLLVRAWSISCSSRLWAVSRPRPRPYSAMWIPSPPSCWPPSSCTSPSARRNCAAPSSSWAPRWPTNCRGTGRPRPNPKAWTGAGECVCTPGQRSRESTAARHAGMRPPALYPVAENRLPRAAHAERPRRGTKGRAGSSPFFAASCPPPLLPAGSPYL